MFLKVYAYFSHILKLLVYIQNHLFQIFDIQQTLNTILAQRLFDFIDVDSYPESEEPGGEAGVRGVQLQQERQGGERRVPH